MREELENAALSVDTVSRLHMYTYQPNYGRPDEFSWDAFLQAGSDLAEDLAQLSHEACLSSKGSGVRTTPIIAL
jgi:hypothetical protein